MRSSATPALPFAIVLALAVSPPCEGGVLPKSDRLGENPEASASPGEVVVTARRREERMLDVPAAISLVSGDWLDRSYTVNSQQASQLVPALYYNSANPRNTAYTLRGLGSNTLSVSAANDGVEPGVGFYVDEVYHARPATAAFDFTDVERIEVLRGPQGTLFGKNTTAGAIHVVSRLPTFTFESRGEISTGSDDFMQLKGSLGGPLADTVAGRISAQLTRRDGLIRNLRTGAELNALANLALKGQLLFEPTSELKLRFIADLSNLGSACCTQSYLRYGQSRRSAARQFPALAAGLGYQPPSTNVYDRVTDVDSDVRIDTQDGGLSLITDWELAQSALTSVSAWRYWNWDVANDRDYTGMPIQTVQRIPSRQNQYSQELRWASTGRHRLEYVTGLYFLTQSIRGKPTSVYGPAAAYWLLNPANFTVPIPRNLLDGYGQLGNSRFRSDSSAAFAELNYAITPAVKWTTGLRYTYESKSGSYETSVSGGPDLSGHPAATAAELVRARLSIFRPQNYRAAHEGGNLSGRTNLAWKATPNWLTYLSFARGFKSGGLNMSGLPLDAQNRPALATAVIADERNSAVEWGLKGSVLEGRATLGIAAFRTVVKDYQANIVSSLETAALRSYPANIPEVRVHGAELDHVQQWSEQLSTRLAVAFADGRNTAYPAGPCPLEVQTAITVACNLTGAALAGLSRWAGSLGMDFRRPLGSGEVLLHVDWVARSGYFNDTSASRYTWIDGYDLTNASLGYRFASGWEVTAFARNLFNANYLSALTIQTGNSGLILGQPGDPRLMGLTIRIRR